MPVDTKHPDYEKMAPAWKLMRDAYAGQRAIHAAGEAYLPKLTGETPADYKARQARASWYNATYRTIEGLVGMLFRKAPKVEVSPGTKKHLEDVTKAGQSLNRFARQAAEEYNIVHRIGLLVDYPAGVAAGLTVAQAEQLNVRPNLSLYQAEDITNWSYAWVQNRRMLVRVVLRESAELPVAGDEFATTKETRYRVLDIFGGIYRQRVFRKDQAGNDQQVGGDIFPIMNRQNLREIPFEIVGDGLPPLEDLAHVNVSHYQTTADLEQGAHKTALPQPWIAGIQPTIDRATQQPVKLEFTIGGGDAWTFPNAETKVGMLEYTGAGLSTLENRLVVKQKQMAVLGARMLEEQKTGVEAAETAGIHRSGEQSALQDQADELSDGFTRVLRWFDEWAGGTGGDTVKCNVNKDFFPTRLGAQSITAIVGAWQAGAMSDEEKFYNFQKGGVISDGTDFETEQTRISQRPPALSPPAPADTPPTNEPALA